MTQLPNTDPVKISTDVGQKRQSEQHVPPQQRDPPLPMIQESIDTSIKQWLKLLQKHPIHMHDTGMTYFCDILISIDSEFEGFMTKRDIITFDRNVVWGWFKGDTFASIAALVDYLVAPLNRFWEWTEKLRKGLFVIKNCLINILMLFNWCQMKYVKKSTNLNKLHTINCDLMIYN